MDKKQNLKNNSDNLSMQENAMVETSDIDERERQRYLSRISTFSKPTKNNNRILSKSKEVNEYDLVENNMSGHLIKRFVRFNSVYFPELFEAIKKGNCSYITYLDHAQIQRGEKPINNISVLVKKLGRAGLFLDEGDVSKPTCVMYQEKIASFLLNYFGVPTVYNKPLIDNGEVYILSVDFLKPNQVFYSAEDIAQDETTEMFWLSMDMGKMLSAIQNNMKVVSKHIQTEYNVDQVNIDVQKLKSDYVRSFLVRVMLLGDTDFNSRNFGYIYDAKANEIFVAPNFDYEYILGTSASELFGKETKISHIIKNYPNEYNDFVQKLKKLTKRGMFKKSELFNIVEEEIEHPQIKVYIYKKILDNVDSFLKLDNKFTSGGLAK